MVDWGRHQQSAARKQAAGEAAQRQREAHQAEALNEERRRLQAQFGPWSDYIDDFMAKAERSRWRGADRRRSGVFSSTIHEYSCRIGNDSLVLRSDGSWGFERRHRAVPQAELEIWTLGRDAMGTYWSDSPQLGDPPSMDSVAEALIELAARNRIRL
jgi:hypothetical protein